MDSKEIEEGNRIIFDFMGCKHSLHEDFDKWEMSKLAYHSSWDALMRVVEKVESIYDDFHGYFGVHIYSNSCTIQGTKLRTDPENFHPAYLSDPNAIFDTKIESTWYNVVQFIKWYQSEKKQP